MLLNVQSLCGPINFKQFQHIHKFDVLRSEYIIERTFKKKLQHLIYGHMMLREITIL